MNWVKMAAGNLSIFMVVMQQKISRSGFGMNRKCKGSTCPRRTMQEAIMRAYGKGVLMFATTRNDGGNNVIAYPARHRTVIGVFSTDGDGNKSGFNPNPPEDDSSYFSTLGEAVESSCPKHLRQDGQQAGLMRESGTSFATPISAAMAANILDYAKLELDMGEKHTKRLHEVERMIDVLKLMAPEKRYGYRYLAPWLLWKSDEYGIPEELEVERTGIRTSILQILMKSAFDSISATAVGVLRWFEVRMVSCMKNITVILPPICVVHGRSELQIDSEDSRLSSRIALPFELV
jgi:hypothetical protein